MKTNLLLRLALTILACCVAAASTGCTHVRDVTFANPDFGAGPPPIPARVALVIAPEVPSFHHTYHMMGDTWDFPLGSNLQQYIRHVAGAAFREVKEYRSTTEAAGHADAIVVVNAPKAEHTQALWAWEKRFFVIRVNWAVNDPSGQSPIWLKTMEGQAQHSAGNAFTQSSNEKKLVQDLFIDLSLKTWQAITNAPELRGISR